MSPSGNGRKSLAFRRSVEVRHPCANIPDDESHEIRSEVSLGMDHQIPPGVLSEVLRALSCLTASEGDIRGSRGMKEVLGDATKNRRPMIGKSVLVSFTLIFFVAAFAGCSTPLTTRSSGAARLL
jgi:hypothetical protein